MSKNKLVSKEEIERFSWKSIMGESDISLG
jgi:hypothetical protein